MRDSEAIREPQRDVESRLGLFARVRIAAGTLALGALVLFLLQNLQEVDVHFLWFDWSTRMLWALLAAGASGGLAAILFGTLAGRKRGQP